MNKQAKNWEHGSQIFSPFSSEQQQNVGPIEKEDASQNGSDDTDTIYINLSNMDGKCTSSPLAMLPTAKTTANRIDVKIIIDPESNSSVATKMCR